MIGEQSRVPMGRNDECRQERSAQKLFPRTGSGALATVVTVLLLHNCSSVTALHWHCKSRQNGNALAINVIQCHTPTPVIFLSKYSSLFTSI